MIGCSEDWELEKLTFHGKSNNPVLMYFNELLSDIFVLTKDRL